MNFVAINKHNGKKYQVKAQHWPKHGWHFQILDPETWGQSTTGVGTGPVIDQGFQNQLEQRGWKVITADPITPGNAANSVGPLQEPENIRDREMKRIAAKLNPKTESRAEHIVDNLLECDRFDSAIKQVSRLPKKRFEPGSKSYQIMKRLTRPKNSFYPSSGGPSSA